ncbi:alkaline phosphatase family protein [bacterium]|nr:alkaline phosphatase family protein [bacterium]
MIYSPLKSAAAFFSGVYIALAPVLEAQTAPTILSGPMLGALEMKEARIWLQMSESSTVTVVYQTDNGPRRSQTLEAVKPDGYTLHFTLDSLSPNTVYNYKFEVRKRASDKKVKTLGGYSFRTPEDWAFRKDPPAWELALGSCTYINEPALDRPGKPYGQNPAIFERIADRQPEVMLWLGDNTYLRPADFGSRGGVLHRYTHSRNVPEMQRLLQTCSHQAIWDDHDFGPNDAVGSYPYKNWSTEAFRLFWANSVYGAHHPKDQTGYFNRDGIDFILLDNRTWRSSPDLIEGRQMLGKSQIDWLIDNLKYSRAPFKIVACGSQVLNTLAKYENMAVYEQEQSYLLHRIDEEGIRGVVFVTGDRHHTELSRVVLPKGTIVYDLTCSPLTSSTKGKDYSEENEHRVEGTLVNENNFGLLKFGGTYKARTLQIEIVNAQGETLWARDIDF